jgi:hypothetical protein
MSSSLDPDLRGVHDAGRGDQAHDARPSVRGQVTATILQGGSDESL